MYYLQVDNTKYSTIGMCPNQAKQGTDNIGIWLTIHDKASFNRKYPPLKKKVTSKHLLNEKKQNFHLKKKLPILS